jgi:hypothetical protein
MRDYIPPGVREQSRKTYLETLTSVVSRVKSLAFPPRRPGVYTDFAAARARVPIPALVNFLGLPMRRNQRCWFCPINAHTTETSFSFYRHHIDGHWTSHAESCSRNMDVVDLWELVVRICRGYPYPHWDGYAAAVDLLARAQGGAFDLTAQFSGGRGSGSNRTSRVGERLDPIRVNYHKLFEYRKLLNPAGKEWKLCSTKLPRPVQVPMEVVLGSYFPENGRVWLAPKVNFGRIRWRDSWLTTAGIAEAQRCAFFVPNYFGPDVDRERANVKERLWVVVEADRFTLEEQYWLHRQLAKHLPLACLLFSGGKSLHGTYCARNKPESELVSFYQRAIELGLDDLRAYLPEQPVRLPGGRNGQQQIFVWNGAQ